MQLLGFVHAAFGEALSPRAVRELGKMLEHVVEEEGQPDAFALAVFADQIHAVVPVATADQRQSVLAKLQSVLDRPDTMLVERGRFLGAMGRVVIGFLLGLERGGLRGKGLVSSSTPVSPMAST